MKQGRNIFPSSIIIGTISVSYTHLDVYKRQMKSPTVMPLAQEGWCSVHTVLDEKCFWEIIGKLKSLGAEGILVLSLIHI